MSCGLLPADPAYVHPPLPLMGGPSGSKLWPSVQLAHLYSEACPSLICAADGSLSPPLPLPL
eukprot:3931864-Rhodomonas_salina.1